ncbi:BUD13 homolog isoform X2 [Hemicordylus capensis]|uniref:BUD13 homolog isoform X2 n=1 Tax=Hemicordylus capensis TaxID=884348 RepID=UPI002302CA27|nr:BUD13 homolog isoform X2 [Hemicordylus capensis]
MAAAPASGLSKAEYLRRRYLEPGEAEADSAAKKRRRRKKKEEAEAAPRMRIVDDDDASWKNTAFEQEKDDAEGDDGDLPVVAEFIDERPEEVKWMEEFRTSNKWKLLGEQNVESQGLEPAVIAESNRSEATKQKKTKCLPSRSPPRRGRHDSPDRSPPRRGRHDSPDRSPPRRGRHDSPDRSPKRLHTSTGKNDSRVSSGGQKERFSDKHSSTHRTRLDTPDVSPPRKKMHSLDADEMLPQKRLSSPAGLRKQGSTGSSPAKKQLQPAAPSPRRRQRLDSESDSDSLPPRRSAKASSDSDLSPPRAARSAGLQRRRSPDLSPPRRSRQRSSDSDLSPPRRGLGAAKKAPGSGSPPDLSPPRRMKDSKGGSHGQSGPQMLSGGQAGLVSAELLRREQQELRRQDGSSKHLEVASRHVETVFRDKSGRKRDLRQERQELQKKAEEKSERDEQYARWGKGLAQGRQQQQNLEDALKEMQKPLARYIDDQDLDKMLREQEREGDPMANFIRKKKAKERRDVTEKPRYNGPAPPLNRFNIWPGYRWDGVDRSNGFEQKRFARIANKKAVQELAYKWSVEDM